MEFIDVAIEEAGDLPAPVYGWRAYRVYVDGGEAHHLIPPFMPNGKRSTWGSTEAAADLMKTDLFDWNVDHSPPAMQLDASGLGHGFHAFHELNQAIEYLNNSGRMKGIVFTKVELGGEVIEHEFGFRAEKLRIIEIHHWGPQVYRDALSEKLGWPFGVESINTSNFISKADCEFTTAERVYQEKIVSGLRCRDLIYPKGYRLTWDAVERLAQKGVVTPIVTEGFTLIDPNGAAVTALYPMDLLMTTYQILPDFGETA